MSATMIPVVHSFSTVKETFDSLVNTVLEYKDEWFLPELIKTFVSNMRKCDDWTISAFTSVMLDPPVMPNPVEWKFSAMLNTWEENTGKISDTLWFSDMDIIPVIQRLNELSYDDLCQEVYCIRKGISSSYKLKGVMDLLFLVSGFPNKNVLDLGDHFWVFAYSVIVVDIKDSVELRDMLHIQALSQSILRLAPITYVYSDPVSIIQYLTIKGSCIHDRETNSISITNVILDAPIMFHRGVSIYSIEFKSTSYTNVLRIEGLITDTVNLQDVDCYHGGVVIADARSVNIQDFAVSDAETGLTLINIRDVTLHTNLGLDPQLPLRNCCIKKCLLGFSAMVFFLFQIYVLFLYNYVSFSECTEFQHEPLYRS